jgi:hypothetical protein
MFSHLSDSTLFDQGNPDAELLGDKLWDFPQLLIDEFTPGNFGDFSILLLIAVKSQLPIGAPSEKTSRNPSFEAVCYKTHAFMEIPRGPSKAGKSEECWLNFDRVTRGLVPPS